MSYIINKTDGSILLTLLDGTVDTTTGLNLIGKNYSNYGDLQNENFVRLLENFASSEALRPLSPIAGQLWFNKDTNLMSVYDGSHFRPVSQSTASTTAPVSPYAGDYWWDTDDQQLHVYSGTQWVLVGPLTKSAYGQTGIYVETITGTDAVDHVVVSTYSNASRISIQSYDAEFQPNVAISGFGNIKPGVNLTSWNGTSVPVFNGNVTNSYSLGGIDSSYYLRSNVSGSINGTLTVSNAVRVGATPAGSFGTSGDDVVIKNLVNNADMYLITTTAGIPTNALVIDGGTGLVSVYADPVTSLGVATKNYVDSADNAIEMEVTENRAWITSNVTLINSNVSAVSAALASTDANVAAVTLSNSFRANVASPAFTGTPTAPTAAAGTSTTQIATTEFVSTAMQSAFPSGGIIMWSGTLATIPTGWALCDGSLGTPNLKDKFIMGAGSTYTPGETGGTASVTLSSSVLPSHTHSISATTGIQSGTHTHAVTDPGHTHSVPVAGGTGFSTGGDPNRAWAGGVAYTTSGNSVTGISIGVSSGDHTHTISGTTGSTGAGNALNILNPYYALAFIMKL